MLVEQLRQAGFNASFRYTSDSYTRMNSGHAQAFIFGHGGSVRDPYFTLRLYHSQFVQPTGSPTPYFWRWKNEEFDAIVDRMGTTDPKDPQLAALFHQALEVWLPNLPAVPLLQFYHRIPHNQTYWKKLAIGARSLYQQRLLAPHLAAQWCWVCSSRSRNGDSEVPGLL